MANRERRPRERRAPKRRTRKRRTRADRPTAARGRRAAEPTAVPADPILRLPARASHPEFELRDGTVERALRTGEHQGLLEDYFGPENYAELRELSREVAARGVRGGPRVLILPGIMGSKIGVRWPHRLLDDVYWFDPLDIGIGRLTELALPGAPTVTALGVILIAYLKLKLRLLAAGYDADFHPYDWRLGIPELGRQLAQRLKRESGGVDLVAHSMGGLVARAALAQGARCRRLVMLGTPNFGSFAPVMALRATYPVVRKVGALDVSHSPEELARDVFSTFPGLTELLPAPGSFGAVDLYDLASWPDDGLRPREPILRQAKELQKALAPGADNFYLIAGVDQRTPTGLRRDDGRFAYEFSTAGDGTVPLDFARLPGLKATYYVAESHGSLPNNKLVGRAVVDLLARGETGALRDSYTPSTRAAVETVAEQDLRVEYYEGRRGGMLSQRELRHLLDEVASPDARDDVPAAPPGTPTAATVVAPAAEPGYVHQFDHVVVGRRRQHRIELRFALGSITELDVRALALGVFRGVTPSGAASALDRRMGGVITDLSRRRMFSGQVGEVFILPTGRHPVTADLVTFVGLGDFDRFNDEVLQVAAENVIRTLVNTRVEEFGTVMFGGGSGENPTSVLRNLLVGFFRGLQDADRDHQFRRIVICEHDPDKYVRLKEELYRLSSTPLCADIELTFDEIKLRPEPEPVELPRLPAREAPVYLIVRQERAGAARREMQVRSSLLTAGAKATVVSGSRAVAAGDFDDLRRRITDDRPGDFDRVGVELGEMLLADEVRTVLPRFRKRHLVVVHDAPLSRVPWEVMALPGDGRGAKPWFPAAEEGLSHRYVADHLSVAKWLEQRIEDRVLNVLLVVNPTEDLDGAEREGDRVRKLLQGQPGVALEELKNAAATRPALLDRFSSGRYDLIHYAGHAAFDEESPERSGLLCHGDTPLTGADLAGLGNLPALVFFNACESGRVRRAPTAAERRKRGARRLRQLSGGVGLAEAFMRGGVANFLGTYWPVDDFAAETFAGQLYAELLAGRTIGEAIQKGRAAVRPRSRDWADYVFYGDSEFVLKRA